DDEATKTLLDKQAGDAANFPSAAVTSVGAAINHSLSRAIQCQRILWSCEQHHLGRALAACRLLDRLGRLKTEVHLQSGDRLLIQAHGQAGLVLALASNLIGPVDSLGLNTFFDTLETYQQRIHAPEGKLVNLPDLKARLRDGAILDGVSL